MIVAKLIYFGSSGISPLDQQHRQLCRKLRGHYAYDGITGNSRSITGVRHKVLHIWYKCLNRRSRGVTQ